MSELNRYGLTPNAALQNATGYFPEGQAPSTVNDAARTVMADVRRHHQAATPQITATYAAGAYAVTYEREVSAGELGGQIWAFVAGAANTSGSATLNINATGAKDIVTPTGHLDRSDIDAQQVCVVAYNAKNTNYELISRTKRDGHPAIQTKLSPTGTNATWTGVPGWVRKITIMLNGLSSDNGANWRVQIGDATGAMATSGYLGSCCSLADSTAVAVDAATQGWEIKIGAAAAVVHGTMVITLEDPTTFKWVAQGNFSRSDAARVLLSSGSVTISNVIDRVRIVTTSSGNFDAGEVNVMFE